MCVYARRACFVLERKKGEKDRERDGLFIKRKKQNKLVRQEHTHTRTDIESENRERGRYTILCSILLYVCVVKQTTKQ